MRTTREVLAWVELEGVPFETRWSDLLVVEREDGSVDWECVLVSVPSPALALAPVRVRLGGHDDTAREGDAIVVRSDGTTHVLRGVGPLSHPDARR